MLSNCIRRLRQVPAMVVSGRDINEPVASDLALKQYSSRWWITSEHAKRLWIDIADSEPAYTTPNNVRIFNITQTEQASKLEQYGGKVMPTWIVGAEEMTGSIRPVLFRYLSNQVENMWIKAHEVSFLELKLKQGVDPTVIQFANKKQMEMYNLDDMVDPLQTRFNAKLYPISAVAGKKYGGEVAKELFRSSLSNCYSSPYWITQTYSDFIGAAILAGETPTSVTCKSGVINLFNADQTDAPRRVASIGMRNAVSPRNLGTGKFFGEPLSTELLSYAMKAPARLDVYWTTPSYVKSKGVDIDYHPSRMYLHIRQGKTLPLFNINATTNPMKLCQIARASWVESKANMETENKSI